MAYRILNGYEEVAAYAQYLDDGWPQRPDICAHICERLNRIDKGAIRILELCTGPGALAVAILNATSVSEYVGVDISAPSLDYVKSQLPALGVETHWLQADVNEDAWLSQIDSEFDAVVSMQSIHDLGGEPEVQRIYSVAYNLLRPRGVFLNADILRDQSDAPDATPGRFTVPRHLELLDNAGFVNVACTLQLGGFGCFESV